MYLTRMELDTSKRKTRIALSTPSIFHGAIEMAFYGERTRNLWRIDELYGKQYLMILSENIPNLESVRDQFGADEADWLSKDYSVLLNRVKNGTRWQFRLAANPTHSASVSGKRGKVYAHITTEHQREWLLKQSEKHGFKLDENLFDVASSRWYRFNKGSGGKHVSMLSVTFEGVLEVSDAEIFKEMLVHGLGREKAYGVGLMTLVGIKGA